MIRRRQQRQPRFIRRLEAEFTADNQNYRGISSDLSMSGVFIRTNHAFIPGTVMNITIHLPSSVSANLTGIVRWSFKTPIVALRNGMGIEIIRNDPNYIKFVKTVYPDSIDSSGTENSKLKTEFKPLSEPSKEAVVHEEFVIMVCPKCGIKNKVRTTTLSFGPKCGKCGAQISDPA